MHEWYESKRAPWPSWLVLPPALADLLLLGTFSGLLITLSSTASALGQTAELNALRKALGAPVQGLGLAFSASVAGVTGSAMLGLMVALARRERVAASAQLDVALLGRLRPLTAAHRRALADAAAEAAAAETAKQNQLDLVAQLQQFAQAMADQLAAQATHDAQRRAEAQADATALAQQREANERLLASQREAAQQLLVTSGQRAQDALTELTAGFTAQTQAAIAALSSAHSQLQTAHAAHDAECLAAWRTELQTAGATQAAQQQQLADGLLQHTRALVAQNEANAQNTLPEAGALLKAAGEAPRAAIEVVAALREQLAQSQAQDRAALAERAELMQTVPTLLASLQQAAGEQRAAVDSLIAHTSTQMQALLSGTAAQVNELASTAASQVSALITGAAGRVDALVGSSATQLKAVAQRFTALADAAGQMLAASAAEMGSLAGASVPRWSCSRTPTRSWCST